MMYFDVPYSSQSLNCLSFKLELKTNHRAQGISWKLKDSENDIVLSGDSYNHDYVYDVDECIHPDTYSFIIQDESGGGLNVKDGSGYYKLMLNNREIYRGDDFG